MTKRTIDVTGSILRAVREGVTNIHEIAGRVARDHEGTIIDRMDRAFMLVEAEVRKSPFLQDIVEGR